MGLSVPEKLVIVQSLRVTYLCFAAGSAHTFVQ